MASWLVRYAQRIDTAGRRSSDVDTRADGAPHTMTTASASASHQGAPDFARFAIGFDQRDRARLHALIDEVLDSNRWSEAEIDDRFEAAWEPTTKRPPWRFRAGPAAPWRRCISRA